MPTWPAFFEKVFPAHDALMGVSRDSISLKAPSVKAIWHPTGMSNRPIRSNSSSGVRTRFFSYLVVGEVFSGDLGGSKIIRLNSDVPPEKWAILWSPAALGISTPAFSSDRNRGLVSAVYTAL